MGLLSSFKHSKIQPKWVYRSKGTIWRLLVTEDGRQIVGEDRDVKEKHVTFFALDALTGNIVWDNVSVEEKWWVGLEDANIHGVFLHRYETPELPGHKGCHVIDVSTGATRWQQNDLRYLFASGNYVYCDRLTDGITYPVMLDAGTGNLLREMTEEELDSARLKADRERISMLEHPVQSDAHDNDSGSTALSALASVSERGSEIRFLEWMRHGESIVAAGYSTIPGPGAETRYVHHLILVHSASSTLRFHDIMLHDAAAIVPDSFFCIENRIFYLREKRDLVCLSLPLHEQKVK
jgi:hypothetical protein